VKKNTAKHVRTCKVPSGIPLRQGCERGPDLRPYTAGSFHRKKVLESIVHGPPLLAVISREFSIAIDGFCDKKRKPSFEVIKSIITHFRATSSYNDFSLVLNYSIKTSGERNK